jgi:DNA-binding NarL/FixJ family response regulator
MRVLLADDRVSLRSALRLLLEHEVNAKVVGETGSVHSLPLFVSRLRPDLLFLDWQLSGLEINSVRQKLMNTIRAIDPNLYIVALTNDERAISSNLLSADAFVNRAEPPERILTVLQQAASQKLNSRSQITDSHLLL